MKSSLLIKHRRNQRDFEFLQKIISASDAESAWLRSNNQKASVPIKKADLERLKKVLKEVLHETDGVLVIASCGHPPDFEDQMGKDKGYWLQEVMELAKFLDVAIAIPDRNVQMWLTYAKDYRPEIIFPKPRAADGKWYHVLPPRLDANPSQPPKK